MAQKTCDFNPYDSTSEGNILFVILQVRIAQS